MRSALMIIVALLIGAVAFYMILPELKQEEERIPSEQTNAPIKKEEDYIVVAQRDLELGSLIDPANDLMWVPWPSGSIAASFIHAPPGREKYVLDPFAGYTVHDEIYAGMPVSTHSIQPKPLPVKDSQPKMAQQVAEETPEELVEIPELPLIANPNLYPLDFGQAGEMILSGIDKIDIVLVRPQRMLSGKKWSRVEPLAKELTLMSQNESGLAEDTLFYTEVPTDIIRQIQMAERFGQVKVVPSGSAGLNDGINRLCMEEFCFDDAEIVVLQEAASAPETEDTIPEAPPIE